MSPSQAQEAELKAKMEARLQRAKEIAEGKPAKPMKGLGEDDDDSDADPDPDATVTVFIHAHTANLVLFVKPLTRKPVIHLVPVNYVVSVPYLQSLLGFISSCCITCSWVPHHQEYRDTPMITTPEIHDEDVSLVTTEIIYARLSHIQISPLIFLWGKTALN